MGPRILEPGYWPTSARDGLVEKDCEPKERCSKSIWKRPYAGFCYSQGMAVRFLGRGTRNAGYKSGANERG